MQTLQNKRATQANDNAVIGKFTQTQTQFLHFFDKNRENFLNLNLFLLI